MNDCLGMEIESDFLEGDSHILDPKIFLLKTPAIMLSGFAILILNI